MMHDPQETYYNLPMEEALAASIDMIGAPNFLVTVLNFLRSTAPFIDTLVVMLDQDRPPEHLYDNIRIEKRAEIIDQYLNGAYLLDPFYEAYLNKTGSRVLHLKDVAPDRFRQGEYYKHYYNLTRLRDELALFVELDDGRHLFYSIGRQINEKRFTKRQIGDFRRVLPIFASLNRRHFSSPPHHQRQNTSEASPDRLRFAMETFGKDQLTPREQEVAALILKGHSSKSIANQIAISPGTVKIHRKNLYRRLGIASQSELFATFLATIT